MSYSNLAGYVAHFCASELVPINPEAGQGQALESIWGTYKLDVCCCRQGRGTKQAYIKISESEIADDYPEPLQYDKVSRLPPVCPDLLARLIQSHQSAVQSTHVYLRGWRSQAVHPSCNSPAPNSQQYCPPFCRWAMRLTSWYCGQGKSFGGTVTVLGCPASLTAGLLMLHEATSRCLLCSPAVLPGCLQLDNKQGQHRIESSLHCPCRLIVCGAVVQQQNVATCDILQRC